ncbi:hypothetical protein [Maribacter luteus]|uniref:hypothetical protein n=1 Tax=Maribacter luteus TaxID=2594478 RepID=UPI002492E4C3|nr:hypothetical protein [Maribacter luteus]
MPNQGKWNDLLTLRNNYLKDSGIKKNTNRGQEIKCAGHDEELFVGSAFIGDVLKFELQEMRNENQLKRMGFAIEEE